MTNKNPSSVEKVLRDKEKDFKILYEAHGRLSKRLKIIEGIANLFLDPVALERNMETAMDFIMESVDAEAGSLLLVDDENRQLYFAAARGPKAGEIMSLRLGIDEGLVGACIRDMKTIVVSDVRRDARFSREIDEALGFETRSVLASPIVFKNTALGAVEVINKKESNVFTADEIELIQKISRLLGALLAIGDHLRPGEVT